MRRPYWSTLIATASARRFIHNCLAKREKLKKRSGPLQTEEIITARNLWIRRVQQGIPENLEMPQFKLSKDENGILRCQGRIPGYFPVYVEDEMFTGKLIQHVHEKNNHLGVANTMGSLREHWWIPHLRSRVRKHLRNCNTCKVYSTKPYGVNTTAALPEFRTTVSRPFQHTGVDFAGPLKYRVGKKEEGKAFVLLFTCASSRAVHLELTKSQTVEEFKAKLNSFITRRTRPTLMISDNAQTFRATASWIRKIRKNEVLQDFLAKQEIRWQFNLSKSPWWGGMYERLIKEVKKTLYKTLGKTHLTFDQLETVVMDIERHLNNRPLTYVESHLGEDRLLIPNVIMWGQGAYTIDDDTEDEEELRGFEKRLNQARQRAWSRWKREYIHSHMEFDRIQKGRSQLPEIGEIALIVGEEKNRGQWKKARVVKLIKGKDGVVRVVTLLHKGNHIERPLQLICPLECRSMGNEMETNEDADKVEIPRTRNRRGAALNAEAKIKLLANDAD